MKVLRENNRFARKKHQCNLCGEIIKVGEQYNSQTNIDSGEIYTFKCHKECWEIANKLNMFYECSEDGLNCEAFEEFINDAFNEEFPNDKKDHNTLEKVNKLNKTLKN